MCVYNQPTWNLLSDIAWHLTNHMTVIAIIGVSCIDDMNDDASEHDSFFRECYRLSPSPPPPLVFDRAWE